MKMVLGALGFVLVFRIYMDASAAGYIDADGIIRTGWSVVTDVVQGVTGTDD